MTGCIQKETVDFEDIQLLVFNIGGIKIGVDISQVAEMLEPEQAAERGLKISRFSDEIPFREESVVYTSPKVLLVKNEKKPHGIVIDRPDDIISIAIDSIRFLPSVVACCSGTKAIWGAAVHCNDIILLVDFYKLTS